jgi:adenylate cyclase
LKGVPEAVILIDVRRGRGNERTQERDPVCGMRLDPSHVVAPTRWKDQPYAFCSRDSAEMFDVAPEWYATT